MRTVLFLTGAQSRSGGTERICAQVASSLSLEADMRVVVLSLSGPAHSHYSLDGRVRLSSIYAAGHRSGILWAMVLFALVPWYLIRWRPTHVIAVDSILYLYLVPFQLLSRGANVYCWEHFNASVTLGRKRRAWARRLASWWANAIIVLTEQDRRLWISRYPSSRPKLRVIPNAVSFTTAIPASADRRKLVLAAGRLVHQKGFDLLIAAWAKIPERTRKGWRLRIVGSGPNHASLERLAGDLGVACCTELPGHAADMVPAYRQASLFVLSSRFEGLPLVLMEALGQGIPCVAFDCHTGPAEIVHDGVNGRLVPAQDVDGLGLALGRLMDDPDELARLAAGTHVGLERFDMDAVKLQWLSLLET